MVQGEPPYLNHHPLKTAYLIATNGSPQITHSEDLSPVFKDYIAKLLEVDVEKRLDASQALRHAFFEISQPLEALSPLIKASRDLAKDK